MSPFRLAFIGVDHPHGAGWRALLPHFASEIELTALVPAFGGGITSLEERYAAVPRHATVAHLLEQATFDGAIVCLPNAEAPAVVAALAGAGKHVLVEKPGAASAADWAPAAEACARQRIAFQSGYLWRYDPGAERLRTMLADGRFGKLISVQISQLTSDVRRRGPDHYLFDPAVSGHGFFNWLGCHMLDLVPYLTGQTVVAVTARVGCFGATPCAVEDGGTVVLELDGGALVTFTGGYWLPRWSGEMGWTLHGSERWVHWDPTQAGTGGVLRIHGPQPQFHAMEETFTLPEDATTGYGGARAVQLIRDWITTAQTGIDRGRNSAASMGQTLQLLDRVYQSSQEGRRLAWR